MNVLGKIAGRTSEWTLADTLYFDSATHGFVRGDLEIDGPQIRRILPPKGSRRAGIMSGHNLVCIPGLIDPDTGTAPDQWQEHSARLAQCGITAAGTFYPRMPDGDEAGETCGIRKLIYVELGETRGPAGQAALDLQALKEFERCVNADRSDMQILIPAIVPGEIWSAASLLAVAALAERTARTLCVRLSRVKADAASYRETRFFTEIGLLSYLSLLSARATVFELSHLSRRDAATLRESRAGLVCACTAMEEISGEVYGPTLSLKDRAVGLSISEGEIGDLNRYASMLIASMTFMHRSGNVTESCDALVDALTRSAANALGIGNIGAIAPDMKADLCLFDRPSDFHAGGDSLHLIKLLVSRRPRHVLVDGCPVVIDGAFQRTLAHA